MTARDSVQASTVVQAPLSRVWRAIADSTEYGVWFGSEFDGPFEAGRDVAARMTPTRVDPEIAERQRPAEGTAWTMRVVAVEPERRFCFRWQPDADSGVWTTVEFLLEETADGVRVTITESGFAALPDDRRDRTADSNAGGWAAQTGLLARYLAGAAEPRS